MVMLGVRAQGRNTNIPFLLEEEEEEEEEKFEPN